MLNELDRRMNKIEDNVYILHEKLDDLTETVALQKQMLDELKKQLTEVEKRVSFTDMRFI